MPTPYVDRPVPDPRMNPGDEPFFEATRAGRLMVKTCRACGAAHHYPRALCPVCFSDDLHWVEASGGGEIYSLSVMRRGGPSAYCIAYVTLDEGVTMLTNIVDCDLDALRIGDRVHLTFKPSVGGAAVPMFTPTGHAQEGAR